MLTSEHPGTGSLLLALIYCDEKHLFFSFYSSCVLHSFLCFSSQMSLSSSYQSVAIEPQR